MPKCRLWLAPVELMLMKAIWRLSRATVQEVRDALAGERDLAYTTVLTMLRSLEEKGFLTHEEEGRRYVYRPLVNREEATASMLSDLLDRAFDGSKELLLTRLLELGEVNEEELRLIRERLASYDRDDAHRRSGDRPEGKEG
jgi:predicted transcriptional regulator